ncbi:hypothetical protein [Actinomadura montaniterrae]|uniref:Uncharacterized protein n=1 Tax=Actinomadura montaniterrae TaxID=1803903 RepID=A0A6L3WA25_9ACTN|nr:hypothetical protein [Actinomadura montaniterrae]KAB2388839.1 hypothetical protein F9B16_02690 [Actinomadura montaniterrae]
MGGFSDLTGKVEKEIVDLDDALLELRKREVVDASACTWRVDPMTQSFIRRGPEDGAAWRPAAPSESAETAPIDMTGEKPGGVGTAPFPPAAPSEPAADDNATLQAWFPSERPKQAPKPARRHRPMLYATVAGAALVLILLIAVVAQVDGRRREPPPRSEPTPSQTTLVTRQLSTLPSGLASAEPYSVPPSERCTAVLTEVSSGDLNRIGRVTERSQYNYNNQRLHAAIYSGWANAAVTIDPLAPVGDPSGTSAMQNWELHDGKTVIAVAVVTWRRAGPTSAWLLTQWPEFRSTS